MSAAPSVEEFFTPPEPTAEGEVPRDQWGHPMIVPPEGVEPKFTTGKWAGFSPYARASGFGQQIEDITNLVKWQKRQVGRGVALGFLQHDYQPIPGWQSGLPFDPSVEPTETREKHAWNDVAEAAEARVGSYAKAEIGTAIHAATERVDRGDSLEGLPPLLIERASAYWRFCQEWGFRATEIEEFGVEDTHEVAGTWDRHGFFDPWGGIKIVGDVKTGSTMDFAGIGYAVQLAEYAHMQGYDPTTQERRVIEDLDQCRALIIHVGREGGSPVEPFEVDITVGWRYAQVVNEVIMARRAGTKSIRPLHSAFREIVAAQTRDALRALDSTKWTDDDEAVATKLWKVLK